MENKRKYERELNDILEDTGINNFFEEMEEYDSHNFGKQQYNDLNRSVKSDTRRIANNANEYDTYLRNTINRPESKNQSNEVNREMYERILEETIAKTRMADFEKQQKDDKIAGRLRESENNKRRELEEKRLAEIKRLREQEEYEREYAERRIREQEEYTARRLREQEEYEFEYAARQKMQERVSAPKRRSQVENYESENYATNRKYDYMNTSSYSPEVVNEAINDRVLVKHNPRDVVDEKRMEELIEATRKFFVHTQLIEERIEKIKEENKTLEKRQTNYANLTIIILAIIAIALISGIVFVLSR
jgi:hypothetical protein